MLIRHRKYHPRPQMSEPPSPTPDRLAGAGNDTDTTAAICGGLAGIYWGADGIPADWLRAMRGHEVVEPLIERLVAWHHPPGEASGVT